MGFWGRKTTNKKTFKFVIDWSLDFSKTRPGSPGDFGSLFVSRLSKKISLCTNREGTNRVQIGYNCGTHRAHIGYKQGTRVHIHTYTIHTHT